MQCCQNCFVGYVNKFETYFVHMEGNQQLRYKATIKKDKTKLIAERATMFVDKLLLFYYDVLHIQNNKTRC